MFEDCRDFLARERIRLLADRAIDVFLDVGANVGLVTLEVAGTRHRAPSALTPLHQTLLLLLDVPEAASARLAA